VKSDTKARDNLQL